MKYAIGMAMLLTAAAANAQAERPPVEYFPAPAMQGRPAPFSSAVRVGDVMYLSGQIGVAPDGKLPDTFDGQAKQTMENIGAALKARGLGWGDVFKMHGLHRRHEELARLQCRVRALLPAGQASGEERRRREWPCARRAAGARMPRLCGEEVGERRA